MMAPHIKRLIVCLVGMLLIFCFHYFVSEKIVFVTFSNGYLEIQDYAYNIIMAKTFWFNGFGNVYDIFFQQHALSIHVGSKVNCAMPLGGTPIALVVWLPFAYMAGFNMALSFTLWSACSIGVLLIGLWNVSRYAFRLKKIAPLPIMLLLITAFSMNTLFSVYLGQTSVLAAGLFIHLIYFTQKPVGQSQNRNRLFLLLLIFMLGIKPPYIALGVLFLIIYQMWKEALYSVSFVLFFLVGITPLLTWEWIPSYLNHLRMFGQGDIPEVYAWAITLESTNIFRSAFRGTLGNYLASLISSVVYYGFYMAVFGIIILEKIKKMSTEQLFPKNVTNEQLFILLVASYLLFVPFAGAYEDVLLLSVFTIVLLAGDPPNLMNYKSIALLISLALILIHNAFPHNKPLWLFWFLKVFIFGYVFRLCGLPKKEKEHVDFSTSY